MNRRSFLFGLAALPLASMTPLALIDESESSDFYFPYQPVRDYIVYFEPSKTWVWTGVDWKDITSNPKPEDSPA